MRKWIFGVMSLIFWSQAVFSIKYICKEKCFQHCKFRIQAVKDCEIYGISPTSFGIKCKCRDLVEGEILPLFFHKTRIIKTSAS